MPDVTMMKNNEVQRIEVSPPSSMEKKAAAHVITASPVAGTGTVPTEHLRLRRIRPEASAPPIPCVANSSASEAPTPLNGVQTTEASPTSSSKPISISPTGTQPPEPSRKRMLRLVVPDADVSLPKASNLTPTVAAAPVQPQPFPEVACVKPLQSITPLMGVGDGASLEPAPAKRRKLLLVGSRAPASGNGGTI